MAKLEEIHGDSESPEPILTSVVDESPSEQTPTHSIPFQIRPKLTPHPSLLKLRNALIHPHKFSAPLFPKFPLLPVEIRLQIWEAVMVPRVHELHPCAKLYNDRMTFRSNASRTPSIFHACRESRDIALQHHQLMEYEPPRSGTSGKGVLRFYFNPVLDTLLLNSLMGLFIMFMLLEDEEDYVGVGVMKGWQRVAFRTSVWPGENGTSLKELTLPPHVETGSFETVFKPMREYLEHDYAEAPKIGVAKVKRKAFIRGDIRYGFRKTCSFLGLRPRGVFRRL
ncbi:hypothetical protein BGZ57DRAFT_747820 [Hyaloscypha finlandica]|nr:hypothetical protein BGZ57DRAFT_747820 [Hyaloscypha finlandica]